MTVSEAEGRSAGVQIVPDIRIMSGSVQQIQYEEDSPVVICESDSKSGILRAIAVRVPDQRSLPVVMEL